MTRYLTGRDPEGDRQGIAALTKGSGCHIRYTPPPNNLTPRKHNHDAQDFSIDRGIPTYKKAAGQNIHLDHAQLRIRRTSWKDFTSEASKLARRDSHDNITTDAGFVTLDETTTMNC